MTLILKNLVVNEKQMLKNINLTNGTIFSQRVLNYLIETKNFSREKAYDLVQKIAQESLEKNIPFKDLILKEKEIKILKEELDELFDLKHYLKEVITIYKRVGIK